MDYGITYFVDDDELHVRQFNCATAVKVRPCDIDGKKCWDVLVGSYTGDGHVAIFDTYDEARNFCSDLADFINDELEKRHLQRALKSKEAQS